ncbi:hypothetical protein [Nocardioides speluncae]|uniref:hypothetical protein n=1 Tax=Nocardioides speluncae TaxID=2670337 RepID=UPI000D694379|nr:hypothetical protein [Nocardioides speluncae]
MGFMPFDALTSSTMSVLLDEISGIATELLSESDNVSDVKFGDMPTKESDFGGSYSGKILGYEHDRAHKVMHGTLTGVIKDLRDFHDGMQKAGREAIDADELSAEDLARIQRLAEMNNTATDTNESQDDAASGDTDTEDDADTDGNPDSEEPDADGDPSTDDPGSDKGPTKEEGEG